MIDTKSIPNENIHPIWKEKGLKYTYKNIWNSQIQKERKEKARRFGVEGVEVRDLPSSHFLHGEQGLFALKPFQPFDILGEYTGLVVGNDVVGNYVATLEDLDSDQSLGVDALHCGNEMRFINTYQNIADSPNVKLQTVYIDSYPHLVVICTKYICIGEEILLDYGPAYTNAYLSGSNTSVITSEGTSIPWSEFPNADDSA